MRKQSNEDHKGESSEAEGAQERGGILNVCVMEVLYHHTRKSGRKTEDGKTITGSGSTEVISDFVQSTSEKFE